MSGPRFVRFFGPVLAALKTLGGSGTPEEVRQLVADTCGLTEKQLTELTPGGHTSFDNLVAWARFYLAKAGFISSTKRGVWTLTDKAAGVSEMSHSDALKVFKDVQTRFGKKAGKPTSPTVAHTTEAADSSPESPSSGEFADYSERLLELVRALQPAGFERLSQLLLRESGFEHVTITGQSGDGGIDGIGVLQVNPFVTFKVLFQCKKYSRSVVPSQVRDFRGAMMGRADKGIIITTGTFTAEARKEALRDGVPPIELVDGSKLVTMCENLEFGLKPKTTFELDESFFRQFEAKQAMGDAE